ncbi:hypothetical protein BDW72DRAFT_182578 [Aspergillus terricola var. indicus]
MHGYLVRGRREASQAYVQKQSPFAAFSIGCSLVLETTDSVAAELALLPQGPLLRSPYPVNGTL